MRRIILIVSAVFLLLFGALQLFLWQIEPTSQEELRRRAASLPSLSLTTLGGQPFQLTSGEPLVLIYFNSTCDHCQRQILAMLGDSGRFSGSNVVFMSAESIEALRDVETKYGTSKPAGFDLVHCDRDQIAERFGVLGLPQIFVYDKEGNLVGLFAGETPTDEIVASLE